MRSPAAVEQPSYRIVNVDTGRPTSRNRIHPPEPALYRLYHIIDGWPEKDFRVVDQHGSPVPASELRRRADNAPRS